MCEMSFALMLIRKLHKLSYIISCRMLSIETCATPAKKTAVYVAYHDRTFFFHWGIHPTLHRIAKLDGILFMSTREKLLKNNAYSVGGKKPPPPCNGEFWQAAWHITRHLFVLCCRGIFAKIWAVWEEGRGVHRLRRSHKLHNGTSSIPWQCSSWQRPQFIHQRIFT